MNELKYKYSHRFVQDHSAQGGCEAESRLEDLQAILHEATRRGDTIWQQPQSRASAVWGPALSLITTMILTHF